MLMLTISGIDAPLSSTHDLLSAMAASGLVEVDAAKRYRCGPVLMRLARAAIEQLGGKMIVHEDIPDHSTLWRFREAVGPLSQALFGEIVRQIEASGFVMKQGTLIDASLIRSVVNPPAPPDMGQLVSEKRFDLCR